MRFDRKDPPRSFIVGNAGPIEMKDCGTMRLAADEQVTLVTESGAEYDVARTSWGYQGGYIDAAASVNRPGRPAGTRRARGRPPGAARAPHGTRRRAVAGSARRRAT